ncbi:hypothetical protein IMG5_202080 [Ichthyophthirius multifiliis]|uniref:5'-nucleotidase n=1 Tax=Ichthyophthirius multifiliis TaxID=5932 RepID=G0R625_ICHMU|nr:hypothetical protein IMG5_202080 [Ichthyophthirius multifiliis]EGR27091.1 hypothetical protein IMG5_202080 [Ichthyophthirius multifiliis]|eukprot:XP_004023975.1 hypothetical protein IMG5_202080 [Ichthyophthirius multifiliis]
MDKYSYLKLKSLKNHQYIGFDVDHCLIRYHIKSITRACYESLMKTLINEKGYPETLLNLTEKEIGIGLNYSLIDINKGTILQIGKNKTILKGYRGFKQINIEEEYGKDYIIEAFEPLLINRNPEFMVLATYFENSKGVIFAKIVDFKTKEKVLKENDYKDIINDIDFAVKQNYMHYNEQRVYKIQQYGTFFKSICDNPQGLIHKQAKFRKILENLKQQNNKFLFIVTNSHFEFINFTMSYSYGDDWQNLFDLIFVKAQKPAFFTNQNNTMYEYDEQNPLLIGKEVIDIEKSGKKIFVEGNYQILENYINSKFGFSIDKKILFFGDNILSDCYYSQQLSQWDSIAIVEELYEELNDNDYWGNFMDKNNESFNSFWLNVAKQDLQGGFIRLVDSQDAQIIWESV